MRRKLIIVALALTVFGAAWAAAASLSVGTTSLAAGTVTVSGCDTSVNTSYTLSFSSGDYVPRRGGNGRTRASVSAATLRESACNSAPSSGRCMAA